MPRMAREQYRPRAFSHEGRITSHAAVKTWSTTGAVVIAALFLTNWPTYQYVVMGGATPLWYYALPAVIVLPIFFAKPENVLRVCREPLFWWFVFYVASGAVWLVLSQDFMEDASQQWRLRVLALFFFLSTAVITIESKRAAVIMV